MNQDYEIVSTRADCICTPRFESIADAMEAATLTVESCKMAAVKQAKKSHQLYQGITWLAHVTGISHTVEHVANGVRVTVLLNIEVRRYA